MAITDAADGRALLTARLFGSKIATGGCDMSVRFCVIALAVSLAACSNGAPPQAPPAAKPESGSTPATGTPAAGTTAQAAATPQTSTPAEGPGASAKPVSQEPEPQFLEITIPAATALAVTLSTPVASDTSKVEDQVRGTLSSPIVVHDVTAVPAGAEVVGTVRGATRSGRVKGRASIAFRFDQLRVRNESVAMHTATISRQAAASHGKDLKSGAIGGGAGAIVGGIVGGGKGAAIGAGVGGRSRCSSRVRTDADDTHGGQATELTPLTRGDQVIVAACRISTRAVNHEP
jgi:hypothetical protein